MDRYPDRRSLLGMLPADRRKRLLDHAEERPNGIHSLDLTVAGRGRSLGAWPTATLCSECSSCGWSLR
jgi:hypothetical protein